jgi:hypothetical protein
MKIKVSIEATVADPDDEDIPVTFDLSVEAGNLLMSDPTGQSPPLWFDLDDLAKALKMLRESE